MNRLLLLSEKIYDRLEHLWHSNRAERIFATLLVLVFVGSLSIIELRRQTLLPADLMNLIPTSHYHAVGISFSLLLVWEVIGLVFAMTKSMSDAVGKQFEILGLILLRSSFKHLVYFEEPIVWNNIGEPVLHIMAHAGGALIIFSLLYVYYRVQRYQVVIPDDYKKNQFVRAKKLVALALLGAFLGTGTFYLADNILYGADHIFFDTFYTILIFSDIFIVLVSLRYTSAFHMVFRNSAFAVTTLIIRLALTAPVYFDVLLGIFAISYAIGLVYLHNLWVSTNREKSNYSSLRK